MGAVVSLGKKFKYYKKSHVFKFNEANEESDAADSRLV